MCTLFSFAYNFSRNFSIVINLVPLERYSKAQYFALVFVFKNEEKVKKNEDEQINANLAFFRKIKFRKKIWSFALINSAFFFERKVFTFFGPFERFSSIFWEIFTKFETLFHITNSAKSLKWASLALIYTAKHKIWGSLALINSALIY